MYIAIETCNQAQSTETCKDKATINEYLANTMFYYIMQETGVDKTLYENYEGLEELIE